MKNKQTKKVSLHSDTFFNYSGLYLLALRALKIEYLLSFHGGRAIYGEVKSKAPVQFRPQEIHGVLHSHSAYFQ